MAKKENLFLSFCDRFCPFYCLFLFLYPWQYYLSIYLSTDCPLSDLSLLKIKSPLPAKEIKQQEKLAIRIQHSIIGNTNV